MSFGRIKAYQGFKPPYGHYFSRNTKILLWSRAFRLGFADSEAPSSNRTCGFPAYGFPCETVVIGSISFS